MTKKLIVTENGKNVIVEMTINEVLVKFENLFNQFAHQCMSKLSGYQDCYEEFDDFKQLAMLKAVDYFNYYNIEENTAYSTILFTSLRTLQVDLIRKYEAQKRKSEYKLVYMDEQINDSREDNSSVISISKGDEYFVDDMSALEKYLIKNLTKEEMLYYAVDLKKQVGKASPMQKYSLETTIDLFASVVGFIPDKKEDLALLLKISRPTLNKRIKETVEKVKELTREFILSTFSYESIPSYI